MHVVTPDSLLFAADQVYGDQDMHEVVRKHCMDYLVSFLIFLVTRQISPVGIFHNGNVFSNFRRKMQTTFRTT